MRNSHSTRTPRHTQVSPGQDPPSPLYLPRTLPTPRGTDTPLANEWRREEQLAQALTKVCGGGGCDSCHPAGMMRLTWFRIVLAWLCGQGGRSYCVFRLALLQHVALGIGMLFLEWERWRAARGVEWGLGQCRLC